MAKKLSTEDILKAARAQAGKAGDAPQAPPEAAQKPAASEGEPTVAPAAEAPKASPAAKPAGAPKSTKDILAAARAQATGAGGGAAAGEAPVQSALPAAGPAATTPGAAAPKSTKDILAAARAQSAAGASSPAGGAAAPKSTKDILAAARAQTGGAVSPAEKPAVKPAAAKATVAAAKSTGEHPSVQDMLKAVREGKSTGETAVAVAAKPALVIPQKPAAPAKSEEIPIESRRGFLAGLLTGLGSAAVVLFGTPFRAAWTSFAGTMGAWGLASARFMMPNVLVEPPSKFKVGPPSDYPPAAVSTKWTAQYGVWVVRDEYKGKDIIYALLTVCTHLGCTPNWLEGERKFKCPCHGSGFYITGINFEGPAPRPLERMAIRLAEDGMLEVDKSRKFQQELGQWDDPASYVEVA